MVDLVKEEVNNRIESILQFIENEIDVTKKQHKASIDPTDKTYYFGYLDSCQIIKSNIKQYLMK